MQIREISQQLQQCGIRASHQRILIYGYLLSHRIHPTVDTIYGEMSKTLPSLSRTTVYNTLKAFADHGLVSTITIEGNENRYDIDTSDHGHFKCSHCGHLYDFDISDENLQITGLNGFTTKQRHIYFRGTCNRCTKPESQSKGEGNGRAAVQ
ncbi:MAG: transcriptional repressor [Nitrospinaceae bacterium]|mgnify:FL=1|nr:transcriptional repressor [Nitrospinaceae bacterium]MBT4504874.1 transcriptional repressor [Gemmatimonadota bacterium]